MIMFMARKGKKPYLYGAGLGQDSGGLPHGKPPSDPPKQPARLIGWLFGVQSHQPRYIYKKSNTYPLVN
jgi:hypothetical protein